MNRALADFFHVSIDYLVGRTDAPARDSQYLIHELSKIQQELERIKSGLK